MGHLNQYWWLCRSYKQKLDIIIEKHKMITSENVIPKILPGIVQVALLLEDSVSQPNIKKAFTYKG